ncbi:ATP-binding response regulator [Noviherbaspirillum aerium]|uniref:ATP-binding response regulator n=1 Tax=Noviherbaspirillum aerium TaxID=2588497 RepID=UPI00124F6607|nr:ATP-binding protein [Noviherbaspirillum aerium]
MNSRVLIIEADEPVASGEEEARLLEKQVRSLGVAASRVAVSGLAGFMKKAAAAGEEPLVVFFGPTIPNPLAVARQLRTYWNKGHLIFSPQAARIEALRRELSRAPMIGSHWSLATLDAETFSRQLAEALRTAQTRMRLRTTLDRANVQISAPKAVDSADYRRMVLSDHYLANLLMQAQDVIVSLDTAQRVVYWSAGAVRKFGMPAEAAIGRLVSDTPLWSQAVRDYLARVATSPQAMTAELSFAQGDASFAMEVIFSAVRDDKGGFIGVSMMMRDVTERKRQLELERQARAQAEQLGRMKDDFLATLSHELRTPLNSILGWAQLLQSTRVPEERLRGGLATIERNALHQAKLIEDLLDISSVISGKLVLDLKPVRLGALVENTVTALRPQAERKRLTLTHAIEADSDIVNGDPDRLQQVISNLLSNAIKFTPEAGSIAVSLKDAGPCLQLVVADTGEGLDQAFLPHIFDRFRQADSSITRRKGGLGLGLAIVKQLVEMHKGSVSATSPGPGLGAAFAVTLPLWGAGETAIQEPDLSAVGQAPSLNGVRVLVVDDEADARNMLAILLEENGARALTAGSGAEALELIAGFDPDLLISDIGMPGIDGYEMLQTIRRQFPKYQDLPAIALTAFAGHANQLKARAAGYQHHIGKPFQASELLAAAANVVPAGTGRRA